MKSIRCPICSRVFERDESPAMPFCSERCRRIDLGRWLGEHYSVPQFSEDESDEAEGAAEPPPADGCDHSPDP
jgi:endogenous inhibitor of DNA gyrase (YacG/DUF329 family)